MTFAAVSQIGPLAVAARPWLCPDTSARHSAASPNKPAFDAASPALTGVTNLQKLPIPLDYGALHIEDYQITVGLSVVGQLLLAVTTVGDRLNLNLVFVDPLVSRERATRIADGLLAQLAAALATGATA